MYVLYVVIVDCGSGMGIAYIMRYKKNQRNLYYKTLRKILFKKKRMNRTIATDPSGKVSAWHNLILTLFEGHHRAWLRPEEDVHIRRPDLHGAVPQLLPEHCQSSEVCYLQPGQRYT